MMTTMSMLDRLMYRLQVKLEYHLPRLWDKYAQPFVDKYIDPHFTRLAVWFDGFSQQVQLLFLFVSLFFIAIIVAYFKSIKAFIKACIDFVLSGVSEAIELMFHFPLEGLRFLYSHLRAFLRAFENVARKFVNNLFDSIVDFIVDFIKRFYEIFILSEQSPLHFLAPVFAAIYKVYSWIVAHWVALLIWFFIFRSIYRFYHWFRYTVPTMKEEWFLERGPTLLFLYHLRKYWNDPETFWDTLGYRDKFWDKFSFLVIAWFYIFSEYYLYWSRQYVKNIDGYRQKKHKQWKKKYIRRPPLRLFVKYHLLIVVSEPICRFLYYNFVFVTNLFVSIFSDILFLTAILLFLSFLWLGFHKFFFDYFIFSLLGKLGFKFPRASLYTQSISTNASDIVAVSNFNSSVVSLRLNSLVDLKNTNLYSLASNKIFTQLPYVKRYATSNRIFKNRTKLRLLGVISKRRRIPRRSRKFITSFVSPISSRFYTCVSYPFKDNYGPSSINRVRIEFPYTKVIRRQFNLVNRLSFTRYKNTISRFVKLKGSILIPKFISNKRDFNTFVLKELLLYCNGVTKENNDAVPLPFSSNYIFKNANNSNELYTFNKDLSIPNVDLFDKSNFFFFNRDFNKISSNRKSSLISDLCHSFMGRFNSYVSENPTFFYDSPIYRHRTGGNFRYKNVYSYDKRAIVSGFKFINNFKLLGFFPRKRIRIYNPYSKKRRRPAKLIRYLKFHSTCRRADRSYFGRGYRRFYKKLFRFIGAMNTTRLISMRHFIKLRKRKKIEKDILISSVIRIRKGTPAQRKFYFKRLLYGKLGLLGSGLSFYKKRYKIRFDKEKPNPKVAFKFKAKYGVNKRRMVFPALLPQSVNRCNGHYDINFMSLDSSLKNLRRNIIFLLRYQNKRKFFKHGTRFLIRSQLFSRRGQIRRGRVLRRFFARSNVYLSFLRSVYSRNVKLLLAVKLISSFFNKNENFVYVPLFHVLDRPWWHEINTKNSNGISYFGLYKGAKSAKAKLGLTDFNRLDRLFKLAKRPRGILGKWVNNGKVRNRALAPRYFIRYDYWRKIRRGRSVNGIAPAWCLSRWLRQRRVRYWFYKNYKILPSILFINPAKDTRWFALDYVPKYFQQRKGYLDKLGLRFRNKFPTHGWISPILYKFLKRTRTRIVYIFNIYIKSFWLRLNSLVLIFVFCVIFGSCSVQPLIF